MSVLARIRSAWNNFIQRLRLSNSQTVMLEVEVIPVSADNQTTSDSTPENSPETAEMTSKTKGKTTTEKLYVTFSDTFIKIDGSQIFVLNKHMLTEQSLDQILLKYPKLVDITLLTITHHSCLSSIPVTVGKLANLTVLDLSFNRLQDLPWAIVYLRKLKILNLTGNQFFTVPPIVGRLTTLEKLLLDDNCLEYLPTSLLQLDRLQVLEVSRNSRLTAPPLSVCQQGLEAVFKHLRKRACRRNLWSDSTSFYRPQSGEGDSRHCRVKSLLEISVASVLQFNVDFFSLTFVPPPLKRHLYDSSQAKMAAVSVAKCSQCQRFFSTQAYFDGHDCLR